MRTPCCFFKSRTRVSSRRCFSARSYWSHSSVLAKKDEDKGRLRNPASATTSAIHSPSSFQHFATEHIGGRTRILSWSPEGRLSQQWRSSPNEGQTNGRVATWLKQMFLPVNYPQSVHCSYLRFHVLQFFESAMHAVLSVLCNQALLESVGVSSEASIFGAVAIQWIIKDGAGEIAKLFFIRKFSPYFDSHPKTFKLLGEALAITGSGIQLGTLLFSPSPANFLACAAGGNILKLVGYSIWYTTHVKFIRSFALQNNMGDVAAKHESQSSLAQLFGWSSGILLLTVSHAPAFLYSIFFVAAPLHLSISTVMLNSAKFESLTVPRLTCLAENYAREGEVRSLRELEREKATGLFGEFYADKRDDVLRIAPRLDHALRSTDARQRWNALARIFKDEKYLIYVSYQQTTPSSSTISIFYHPTVTPSDQLKSVMHATKLCMSLATAADSNKTPTDGYLPFVQDSLHWTNTHLSTFQDELKGRGWIVDEVLFADKGCRLEWAPPGFGLDEKPGYDRRTAAYLDR